MKDIIIGVNLPQYNPNPEVLRQNLTAFAEAGFDHVEIGLDTLPLITAGHIQSDYVKYFKDLLYHFGLSYSAHVGTGIDLRNSRNYKLQKQLLFSSIEVCSQLGLNPLIIHYDMDSRDDDLENRFLQDHIAAAEYAAAADIDICIENMEIERVEKVIAFIQAVNRPNFRLCLDTGHLYLASRYFHFDFLAAVRECVPYLQHIHLNDNFGIYEELRSQNPFSYEGMPVNTRYSFGSGDIHLPPFWGEVPFTEIFALLGDYPGIYLCEHYTEYFQPFLPQVQEQVRQAVLAAELHHVFDK